MQVGSRWVTHESDDARWQQFRIDHHLPPPKIEALVANQDIQDENNENSTSNISFNHHNHNQQNGTSPSKIRL